MSIINLKDSTLLQTFYNSHEGTDYVARWDGTGYALGHGNHFNADGSPVRAGQTIDSAGADALAAANMPGYTSQAAGLVGVDNFNNLNASQQAALVDITANYGVGKVKPEVIAAFQSGDQDQIDAALRNQNNNCPRDLDRIAMMHGADPANVTRGGPSQQINSNTRGAATGSRTGCAGAGLGIFGAIAAAGLLGGFGAAISTALSAASGALGITAITGAMGGALSAATQALGGGLSQALGAITGPLNQLSGGVFQSLSQIGSGILPSLTGVLPQELTQIGAGALGGAVGGFLGPLNAIIKNPLNLPNAIQQFGAAGGLNGMIQSVAGNMVGGAVAGGTAAFVQTMGITNAFSGISNSVIGATAEAAALRFGASGPGGMGANFVNNNGVISFGMSALTSNLPAAASDLSNLGTFATTNLLRLQQPANLAKQIMDAGLGTTTGLTQQLIKNNIPVAGVDNPQYDTKVQQILSNISDPTAVGAVSSNFNVGKQVDNLGQLTDLSYMCPDLYATGPSKSFSDLGQHFISLGITKTSSFDQIGTALSKVDAGIDLNHMSQMATPMYPPAADVLNQKFGYGGGSIGEITMADFIGTAAGYVHNDTLPVITNANNVIMQTADGQELARRVTVLQTLLTGGYHVPGSAADPSTGQPAQQDSIVINGVTYYTLDDAVNAQITSIESQLSVIKANPDPNIQAAIQASEAAHAASCAQILKENHHCSAFGVDLFSELYSNNPVNAFVFADGLSYYGQQNGYGQIGDYLERVAQDNIYGDAIKAAMRQGNNASVLSQLGVNVERFRLPHSQYLRDPSTFYLDAYSGNLPEVPELLADTYIPQTDAEIYSDTRNSALVKAGYDPSQLLPAQADELYYDLQWKGINDKVLEEIGLSALQQVVDSNVVVLNDKMYVIGLDRSATQFGTITDHGLILLEGENFVATVLSIANKVLYGDIGTTKYENPFMMDQMTYGMLEMLSQLTPTNIDGLRNTLLGSTVMRNLLPKLGVIFDQLLQVTDTGMDRNIVAPWGAAGPDGQTTVIRK
jgi:GH24 family phage-related lysozyme (muramidase)